MAERDFVQKMKRAGFTGIEIVQRDAFGVDDANLHPLFTTDLIEVIRQTVSEDKQHQVATSVVIKAHLAG
jgi:hypothetical protein